MSKFCNERFLHRASALCELFMVWSSLYWFALSFLHWFRSKTSYQDSGWYHFNLVSILLSSFDDRCWYLIMTERDGCVLGLLFLSWYLLWWYRIWEHCRIGFTSFGSVYYKSLDNNLLSWWRFSLCPRHEDTDFHNGSACNSALHHYMDIQISDLDKLELSLDLSERALRSWCLNSFVNFWNPSQIAKQQKDNNSFLVFRAYSDTSGWVCGMPHDLGTYILSTDFSHNSESWCYWYLLVVDCLSKLIY